MLVCQGLFTALFNWGCEWTKREMRSIDVNAACFAQKKSGSSCFPSLQSGRLSSVLECGTLVTLSCCYGVIFVHSWFKTCGKSESRNSGINAGKVYPAWDEHGVPFPCRRTFPSDHMLSSTPSCSTCLVFDWFLVRFAAWTFGSQTMSDTDDFCGCVVHSHTGIIPTSRPQSLLP